MKAAVSLGSNLGDRLAALGYAVAALDREVRITAVSPVYLTDPVGGPAQPEFANAVVNLQVHGDRLTYAERLLGLASRIEEELDRVRTQRWGPRTIDVDILAVGDLIHHDPRLEIPHPRLVERAFVLVPWADIDPDFVVPGLGRVRDLAQALTPVQRAGVRQAS